MAKSIPKLPNKVITKIILWGLLLFFSFIIIVSYIFKMKEGLTTSFDVSDVSTGNAIASDPSKMANIFSYLNDSSSVNKKLDQGTSNTYTGPVSAGSTLE
jgi:hypothetical protein